MSTEFDSRLTLQLKESAWCGRILALLHAGAAACVSAALLTWPVKLALWLALAASLFHGFRMHATRTGSRCVSALLLEADGELSVRFGSDSAWYPCRIDSRAVYPGAVLLRLRRAEARLPFSVVVAADAVEPAAFRRLRARLRLGNEAA